MNFRGRKMRIAMQDRSLSTTAVAAGFLLAAPLALAVALPLHAASAPQLESISLNAGQTQVIDHLAKGSKPTIRVIDNPHALVIHDETPGQVVLLGAERGQWEVTVTRDDGARIAYRVNVAAVSNGPASVDPGTYPVAASDAASTNPPPDSATNMPAYRVDAFSSDDEPPVKSAPSNLQQPVQLPINTQPVKSYRSDPIVRDEGPPVSLSHNYLPDEVISVMNGGSEIIDFRHRLKRISIADSTVADIQVTSPYQLNLIGHKPGFTTLTVWDDQGHYVERQVRIDPGGKQQVMLNVIVAELDRTRLENQGIDLSIALPKSGLSLSSLAGSVATPYGPTSLLQGGTSAISGVAPPGGELLPLLLSSTMTYGLATASTNYATQTFFQFLETHNLGRILAQPHLLANSGQSASFLSGGEIPIVLAQALNTSIVFKEFGTKIDCRPTVIGRHEIELLVKTEVSEPDFAHGVALFGFTVPAFVTRKADTLVRLMDGQTLIIAGLLLRTRNAVVSKVPYLGDLPYAGALFRNTSWEDEQTDLVMSVQPEIVSALPPNAQVFEPSQRGPLTDDEVRTQRLATPDASRPRF